VDAVDDRIDAGRGRAAGDRDRGVVADPDDDPVARLTAAAPLAYATDQVELGL
jgi:hypothetical protein